MASAAPTIHTMPGTVDIPIATFPASKITNTDALQTAQAFVDTLNTHIAKADTESLAALFLENGYWRDHLALTWEFRTVQSPSNIAHFLAESAASRDGFRLKSVALDTSEKSRTPFVGPVDAEGKSEAVQFFITFQTALGFGGGTVRLAADGAGGWKIFTLATILQGLSGFEEPVGDRRPQGVDHGQHPGRTNWADRRKAAENYTDGSEPTVIIVGEYEHRCTLSTLSTCPDTASTIMANIPPPRRRPGWSHCRRPPKDARRQRPHCRQEQACR